MCPDPAPCCCCPPPLLLPGRLRRHHQAQREFEDKLAGVRSAVDAWLHRAHHQASTGSAASEGTRVVPSAMEGAAPPAAASGGSGQQGVAQDASPGAADAPQHGKRGLPDAGGMQIASAALAALQAATAAKAVAGAGPGPAGTSAAALHGGCGAVVAACGACTLLLSM
jgi:hypothetical protein